jgi:uncharacterized membrane protein
MSSTGVSEMYRCCGRAARGGIVLIYTIIAIIALMGILSLAVDYGRVVMVRGQMQDRADATALAAAGAYAETQSLTYAQTAAYTIFASNDDNDLPAPTMTIEAGSWNASTQTFSTTFSSTSPACRITLSRTSSANNAVPLVLGPIIGKRTCDVRVTSVALVVSSGSANLSVPSTSNPYLANMPAGTATPWGDNTTNA